MKLNRNGKPFGENLYLTERATRPAPVVMPQRFTWKVIATYDFYEDARAHAESKPLWTTKIKRHGGRFEVRRGTVVK